MTKRVSSDPVLTLIADHLNGIEGKKECISCDPAPHPAARNSGSDNNL